MHSTLVQLVPHISVLLSLIAGLLTFVGRAMHAYAVALDGTTLKARVIGMAMTISALAFTSVHLLCKVLSGWLQQQ